MKVIILSMIIFSVQNTYINPVISVDAPDPGILYYQNSFWIVSTTGNWEYMYVIRKSGDLKNWEDVGTVFAPETKPSWSVSDYWAPELHIVNNNVNVYFSARHTNGKLCIGGGVSTSGSPSGPYKAFDNPIVELDNIGAIDVNVAQDVNTKDYYIFWKVETDKTPIHGCKLNSDGSQLVGSSVQVLMTDQIWEGPLIEGPWVHYHEGYYYMFYSGQPYTSAGYSVGIARSRNILGPYEKAVAPILTQIADNANGQYFTGPGHNSIVTLPNTNVDVIVYHSWQSGKIEQPPYRVVLIDKIWWVDGWPIAGVGGTPSYKNLPEPLSQEFADMPINVRLTKNTLITISSYQWSDHCWNVADSTIDGDCNLDDNKLYVRAGNAGQGTFSFESMNKPNFFWRHRDGNLYLDENDGTDLFKLDSSFIANSGAEDETLLTLRPINYPFSVIRHKNGNLMHSEWTPKQQFGQDATWRVNVISLK